MCDQKHQLNLPMLFLVFNRLKVVNQIGSCIKARSKLQVNFLSSGKDFFHFVTYSDSSLGNRKDKPLQQRV